MTARRLRLGTGELTPVRAENAYARWVFLQAVERCVPEALRTLAAVDEADDAALDAWTTRWGFSDAWARHTARQHVPLWRENPTLRGRWHILTAVSWEPVPPAVSWNPVAETEASFRRRVEHYIATIRRNPGLAPTPTKDDERHFEWLALHHVGGYPYQRIVERYQDANGRPDVPAISRAVTQTAALAGVTLRPQRGRKLRRATHL